jgi:hypothetical protein
VIFPVEFIVDNLIDTGRRYGIAWLEFIHLCCTVPLCHLCRLKAYVRTGCATLSRSDGHKRTTSEENYPENGDKCGTKCRRIPSASPNTLHPEPARRHFAAAIDVVNRLSLLVVVRVLSSAANLRFNFTSS